MGHEFVSPLRRWDIVAGLCEQSDARLYIEVGCKDGRTTGFVLASCPQVRSIAIDPYQRQEANDDPARETYEEWDFAAIQAKFWENIGENVERCKVLREYSCGAAAWARMQHMEGQADVIFIDARHDYESVTEDIQAWWPMVRTGGFLCGHDYNHKWPSVMRAVADHFPLMRVGVCPDSVWIVQKDDSLRLAA